MPLEFFLNLYPETMLKEIYPLCSSPKCGEPKTLAFMSPREYVPVSQTLIISKYSNVNPHFKGNLILNHNQVVKSTFLAKSRHKHEGVFHKI